MDLEKFLAIEKQYGLPEENVDGFYFWVYSRIKIQWQIRDKVCGYSAAFPQGEKTFFDRLALRAGMIYNALFHGHVSSGPYDVLVVNSPRRVWVDDHYECVYTDDIVKEMKSVAVLEGLFEQRHFKPVTTPNLFYLDGIEMRAQLNYYYHKYCKTKEFAHTRNLIYNKIEKPLRELAKAHDTDIDCGRIVDSIMPELYKYRSKKKSFDRIVKKTAPKVILEVNSEAPDCMAINEVAKEHGIPIVELQHGIMGKEHIVYNYPQGVSVKQFPDYLFVFSDFWKYGNRCPIPDEHIISVGFPYLEKQRRKYSQNAKEGKTVLLFLSQGTIADKLVKIAVGVLDSLKNKDYKIIYKLHPGEYATWREKLPELLNTEGIEVIDNNQISLYELFAKTDIQIGFASTAIFEGLSYHLDTYIYTQNNNSCMTDLVECGYAHGFTSSEELVRLIENRDSHTANADGPNQFWADHALDNMKEKLNMLISGEDK